MISHVLNAGPGTCHWGYFDAGIAPAARIASGDRVTIDTVSGAPHMLPDRSAFHIPPELDAIHAVLKPDLGPHILTGPVFVEGAMPGDVLELRILEIELLQDWGYNLIIPLRGTLPNDFEEGRCLNIPLDKASMTGRMPWGLDLPLSPFFGVMGVAPPKRWGRISSTVPQATGGNLDNKELRAGSSLFLPVFTEGALFSCGDGHGAQGDGEVCITAIETALRGTFEFHLHKEMGLAYPRAETPSHYITMGMDPSLDECAKIALRDMIKLIGEKAGLSREDAYTLCSLAGDLHVTQTVNISKGVHMMLEKRLLA